MKTSTRKSSLTSPQGTLHLLLALLVAALVALLAAPLQASPPSLGPEVRAADDEAAASDSAYRAGREAIDAGQWKQAVEQFAEVQGDYADAALYWSAYAHFKAGDVGAAQKSLRRLRRQHPDSRWADDARTLEMEMSGRSGHVAAAAVDEDMELKLFALQSLVHSDSERALPILLRILDGDGPAVMRQQALFVLTQSEAPQAREILLGIARGERAPDLRRDAVHFIGMSFGEEGAAILGELYRSAPDRETRIAALQSLAMGGGGGADGFLLEVVRSETDPELRHGAIQALGIGGSAESWSELRALFEGSTDGELRRQILGAAAMSSHGQELVMAAIRDEKDPELRLMAIQFVGINGGDEVSALLDEIYRDGDRETKIVILQAYGMNDEDAKLIRIAKTEKDHELRKAAVQMLSMSSSKEATDFLMSLLEER